MIQLRVRFKYCSTAGLYGAMEGCIFGPKPVAKSNPSPQRKPLHLVCGLGSLDCARLLLEAGGPEMDSEILPSWKPTTLTGCFLGGLRESNFLAGCYDFHSYPKF